MTVDIYQLDSDGLRMYDDQGKYVPKGKRNPPGIIEDWVADVQFKKIKKDLSECRFLQRKIDAATEEEAKAFFSYREDAKKLKAFGFYEQANILDKIARDEQRHSAELEKIARKMERRIKEALGYV